MVDDALNNQPYFVYNSQCENQSVSSKSIYSPNPYLTGLGLARKLSTSARYWLEDVPSQASREMQFVNHSDDII